MIRFVFVVAALTAQLAFAQPKNGCPNPNATCASVVSTAVTATTVNSATGNFNYIDAGSEDVTYLQAGVVDAGTGFIRTLNSTFVDAGSGLVGGCSINNTSISCATALQAPQFCPESNCAAGNFAFIGSSVPAVRSGGTTCTSWSTGTGSMTHAVGYIDSTDTSTNGSYRIGSKKWGFNIAPTISSGFGTSPSVAAYTGTFAFKINVGTGGVATSGVIGLPTVTTDWVCNCDDMAAAVGLTETRQSASTTASCTVSNVNTATGVAAAWSASEILYCLASPSGG